MRLPPLAEQFRFWPGMGLAAARRCFELSLRTVVFAFWTGEEESRFGSGHYARYPRWPFERTRAYVNLDMIGHRWLPDEVRKLVA